MRIIRWNCRGLGGAPTVRYVASMTTATSPSIFFLSETKCTRRRANDVSFPPKLRNKFFLSLRMVSSTPFIACIECPPEKRFRFENWWLLQEDCKQVVQRSWTADSCASMPLRLRRLSFDLSHWAGAHRLNLRAQLDSTFQQLTKLQRLPLSDPARKKEGSLTAMYEDLLYKQELFWAQRAKDNWIRFGDRNTTYFYAKAS
uniref:Uncharacterized protein n=1 Tax=Ananas comosus var. bracteatus TaxID=296719 RepID=A0A6V7NWQ9_ANACO|nr:unnamed protein product [Ananas comosus var. bracteatus]